MSRRRASRHLALVAVGSGLVTLTVAVTGTTPVWLAAGPLLLVILDTLIYSPMVRSRLSQLGAALHRSALPARVWGDPAYRSRLREELRMARRELDGSLPRRLLWELGVFRYFLPPYVAYRLLFPVLGAGLALVATGLAGFVSETAGPLGVALATVGGALLTIALGSSVWDLVEGPSFHWADSPVPWLRDEIDASGATMPLLMFSFSDQSDPGIVSALMALAIPRSRGRALLTLDHNLLVTGSDSDLARILAALPAYIPAAHRARLLMSRADYPQDGTTPEALLSAAKGRLAPIDEAELDSHADS
jgi:hypothetical protein